MNPAIAAWTPKSILLLRDYNRHKFLSDLLAGVTVGLVALPLAMAFAIASGVSPQAGIYTAIVTGFLISALGGSKTQIGGPTGAFVVVVAGIVAKYGIDGLFTCTLMAGVLLILLGVTGLGTAVKYFPRPVIIGFTNGIAILIASTQIRDLLGLRMDHVPGDFFHRMQAYARAWNTMSLSATAVSLISIAVMVFCLKYAKRVPGAILVTFGATAAVVLLRLPVETIGTRFGGIPSGLPALAAIRMIVAYNMCEWHEIPEILKLTKADISVWFLTVILTVVTDLTFAVEVGMVLAALMFIRKVSRTTTVTQVTQDYVEDGRAHILQGKDIPPYVTVFRVHGPFLFGATDKFNEILDRLGSLPPIVILRLRNMTAIDATGLGALRDLADTLHASGRSLLLCGAREQPAALMHQAEFERHVGRENICPSIADALARAAEVYTQHHREPVVDEMPETPEHAVK